jgi:hypothetical protein
MHYGAIINCASNHRFSIANGVKKNREGNEGIEKRVLLKAMQNAKETKYNKDNATRAGEDFEESYYHRVATDAKKGFTDNPITRKRVSDDLQDLIHQVPTVAKKSVEDKHSATTRLPKKARSIDSSPLHQEHVASNHRVTVYTTTARLLTPEYKFEQEGPANLGGTTKISKRVPARSSAKKAATARQTADQGDIPRKPKRPMSAYNFFFKEERSSIAAKLSSANNRDEINRVLEALGAHDMGLDRKPSATTPDYSLTTKKKMFNGFVSFEDIGKIIGHRWRSISGALLAKYTTLADADTIRYQNVLKKYYEEYDAYQRAQVFAGAPNPEVSSGVLDRKGSMPGNVKSENVTPDSQDPSSMTDFQIPKRPDLDSLRASTFTTETCRDPSAYPRRTTMDSRMPQIQANPRGLELVSALLAAKSQANSMTASIDTKSTSGNQASGRAQRLAGVPSPGASSAALDRVGSLLACENNAEHETMDSRDLPSMIDLQNRRRLEQSSRPSMFTRKPRDSQWNTMDLSSRMPLFAAQSQANPMAAPANGMAVPFAGISSNHASQRGQLLAVTHPSLEASLEGLHPSMVTSNASRDPSTYSGWDTIGLTSQMPQIQANPCGLELGLKLFAAIPRETPMNIPFGGISGLGSFNSLNSILTGNSNILHLMAEISRQPPLQSALPGYANSLQKQGHGLQESELNILRCLMDPRMLSLNQQQRSLNPPNPYYATRAMSQVTLPAIHDLCALFPERLQQPAMPHPTVQGVSTEDALQLLLLSLINNNNNVYRASG